MRWWHGHALSNLPGKVSKKVVKNSAQKISNIRPNRSARGGVQYVSMTMSLFMFVFVSFFDLADACQKNRGMWRILYTKYIIYTILYYTILYYYTIYYILCNGMTKRYIMGWHTMHAWCCCVVAVIFHAVGLNHIYPPTSPLNLHVSMFFPYVQFFIYFCDLWRCDFSHLWPEPCWLSVMIQIQLSKHFFVHWCS